ncbi:MAG TPA: TadE/TadG family type IV pilus assembly protein [Gemmataceae bacterium]|nr:TadE/TadG family type IV pilus assembly protein [Gemmataceae bacterium]
MRITTTHPQPTRGPRARRRGVLILAELLFVLPILMMFFLGILEFHMMVATRVDLLNASRAAARVAASDGYTFKTQADTDAHKTAKAVLGTGRLSRFAHVHITWSQDLPPDQTAGQADWVEAKVEVRARSVIPDVLGWLGFSLGGRSIVAATRMKQE